MRESDSTATPGPRTVGVVLLAGFVIFWLGAPFWTLDFQQPDTADTLAAIHAQSGRWIWIHTMMAAGTVVTAAGYQLWHRLRAAERDPVTSSLSATFYLLGAAAWLVAIILRLTVTLDAASAVAMPEHFESFDHAAQGLLVAHLLLSHAAAVAGGVGLLIGRPRARVIGALAIVTGSALAIGLAIGSGPMQGLMAPLLAQLFSPAIGIWLLTRRSNGRRPIKPSTPAGLPTL